MNPLELAGLDPGYLASYYSRECQPIHHRYRLSTITLTCMWLSRWSPAYNSCQKCGGWIFSNSFRIWLSKNHNRKKVDWYLGIYGRQGQTRASKCCPAHYVTALWFEFKTPLPIIFIGHSRGTHGTSHANISTNVDHGYLFEISSNKRISRWIMISSNRTSNEGFSWSHDFPRTDIAFVINGPRPPPFQWRFYFRIQMKTSSRLAPSFSVRTH